MKGFAGRLVLKPERHKVTWKREVGGWGAERFSRFRLSVLIHEIAKLKEGLVLVLFMAEQHKKNNCTQGNRTSPSAQSTKEFHYSSLILFCVCK